MLSSKTPAARPRNTISCDTNNTILLFDVIRVDARREPKGRDEWRTAETVQKELHCRRMGPRRRGGSYLVTREQFTGTDSFGWRSVPGHVGKRCCPVGLEQTGRAQGFREYAPHSAFVYI